jgi:hypothetical protein
MKQLLFAGFVALGVGCGGVVNYTEDGGEGAAGGVGGAGPSTTTSPTTDPTTTTTNTNVTTGPVSSCEVFCGALNNCQEDFPDCLDECAQIYTPGCEGQAEALVQCYVAILSTTCTFSEDDCVAEANAYAQCSSPTECFTTGCDDGPGCSCTGECFGGTLDQFCKPPAPGPDGGGPPPPPEVECECYFDGSFFGTCFQDPFQCSIEEGCCQFLLSGPQPG